MYMTIAWRDVSPKFCIAESLCDDSGQSGARLKMSADYELSTRSFDFRV
jgi:hypothetical protein